MAELDFSALNSIVDRFVEQYKRTLQNANKVASGELINNTQGVIEYDGRYITIKIEAPEQWRYIEYGRKPGKFPPPAAIESWVKVKGLPRSNYSARTGGTPLPTEKQLAFLIGRKIAKFGIPAGNYLTNTLQSYNLEAKVKKEVSKMLHQRFLDDVKEEINEIKAKLQ